MKTLLAMMLVLCMIFACSCSSKDDKGDTTTDSTPVESTTAETSEDTTGTEEPGDTTAAPTGTEVPVDTSTGTTEEPRPTEFSRGTINGNVYENAFAEITFTKPESWSFMSDAELSEQIGIALDKLNAKNPFENEDVLAIFDALASDENGNNISISFEETTLSVAEYLTTAKEQLSPLGYTFDDVTTVTLGGVSYSKLVVSVTMEGVTMQQGLYVRSIDGLMCILTVTVVDGSNITSYEAMFS